MAKQRGSTPGTPRRVTKPTRAIHAAIADHPDLAARLAARDALAGEKVAQVGPLCPHPHAAPPISLVRFVEEWAANRRRINAIEAGDGARKVGPTVDRLCDREVALLDLILTRKPRSLEEAAGLSVGLFAMADLAHQGAETNGRALRMVTTATGCLIGYLLAATGMDPKRVISPDFHEAARPYVDVGIEA